MTEKEKCRKCGAPCVLYYCEKCKEAHRKEAAAQERLEDEDSLMAELYGDDEE